MTKFIARNLKKIIIAVVAVVVLVVAIIIVNSITAQNKKTNAEYNSKVNNTLNVDTFYEGISVAGLDLGGKKKSKALKLVKKVQKKARPDIKIKVLIPGGYVTLKKDDFKFTYNTVDVINEAFNYARTGSLNERYKLVEQLKSKNINYDIKATLVKSSINDAVKKIADKVDIEAVEPRISDFMPKGSEMFIISDGKNGRVLVRDDLKEKIKAILADDSKGTIKAETRVVKFFDTAEGIKKRVSKLGSFSTTSVNVADADYNMSLALKSANGTRLEPGEVFSFNAHTGNTTNASNGYRKAGAINGGKLIDEYGGGICQVSTTIYGAALRSDLEIIERHNHTWPSVYVPIGQDASVNYPYSDFKFKNTKEFPIFISAKMTGKVLTVEFFGDKSEEKDYDYINVVSEKTETIARPAAIKQNDSSLYKGTTKQDRKGRDGYRAKAYKVYYKNGRELYRKEIASSYYPPVAEIIKVGTK